MNKLWVLAGVAVLCLSAARPSRGSTGTLSTDDLVEIQQLYARYSWTIDAGDGEGWAATFTADGVFNTNVGHDALVKFATTFHSGLGTHVRHWNTNMMIAPTSDGARGQVYLVLMDFGTKPTSIAASATYSDVLIPPSDC